MRSTRIIVLAAATVLLAGCSPLDQGAVTLDEASGNPRVVVALCADERVDSVTLEQRLPDDERAVLWQAEGRSQPGGTFSATVGVTPTGFVQTVPLAKDLPETELIIIADTSGGTAAASQNVFTVDELEPGVLSDPYIGTDDSLHALEVRALRNCKPFWEIPWQDRSLIETAGIIGVPALFVAILVVLVAFRPRLFGRRRSSV